MTADSSTALAGIDVVTPADAGWDEARRAWNLAVDQRPAMVALPDERRAGGRGRPGRPGRRPARRRPGDGSRVLGPRGAGGGAADQHVPHARTWVDAGAPLRARGRRRALARTSCPRRRARAGGPARLGSGRRASSATPSAAACGWLGRRHGLAAQLRHGARGGHGRRRAWSAADAETEPDLFWALRGGGGSFGVVTAIEFRLYPVDSLNAGWLIWPWEEARRVLTRWAEWTRTVPDEVTSVGRILQLPPLPGPARGRPRPPARRRRGGDPRRRGRGRARSWRPLRELGPRDRHLRPDARPRRLVRPCTWTRPSRSRPTGDGCMIDALPPRGGRRPGGRRGPRLGLARSSPSRLRHVGGALGRVPHGAGALGRSTAASWSYAAGIADAARDADRAARGGRRGRQRHGPSRWGRGPEPS